ncbi:MAG: hypothetical protein K2H88_02560 [Duncaniella sp.]|nr:hypothetical protein [Duncaniella sp.]MDE5751501.1 hypothetical protein [Duncaniella sp.]MDE6328031.1 hypothetical protein [Duncaniella sp.]MDE6359040.1 hypothetical protein [Duncaniella sp.]MDE6571693.1 hypothetical protein [Duncaniella sp.]
MKHLLVTLSLLLFTVVPAPARKSVLDGIPRISETLAAYREDSVRERLSTLPLHEIEGIWEFAGEGTLMAIERAPHSSGAATLYRMVAVSSSELSLRPGTVMGYLTPSSKRGIYDARIYSSHTDEGTRLWKPEKFTVTLGDDGTRITVKPYGRIFRVNWWRLVLPYMYRRVISRIERPAGDIEGCVRVYPAPSKPLNPRYL